MNQYGISRTLDTSNDEVQTYNIAQFVSGHETRVVAERARFEEVLRSGERGMRLWETSGGCDEMKGPAYRLRGGWKDSGPRQSARNDLTCQLGEHGAHHQSTVDGNRLHIVRKWPSSTQRHSIKLIPSSCVHVPNVKTTMHWAPPSLRNYDVILLSTNHKLARDMDKVNSKHTIA